MTRRTLRQGIAAEWRFASKPLALLFVVGFVPTFLFSYRTALRRLP